MANPPCMSEDGNAAVFVGTMLATGDAVALCDECLVPWCAAVLQAMTGIDAGPFLAAVSEDAPPTEPQGDGFALEGAGGPEAEPDPPPPPKPAGRSRNGSAAAPTATAAEDAPTGPQSGEPTPAA